MDIFECVWRTTELFRIIWNILKETHLIAELLAPCIGPIEQKIDHVSVSETLSYKKILQKELLMWQFIS